MSKKVLLTSVCRPIEAKYGNAPSVGYELLHGQVTRAQGRGQRIRDSLARSRSRLVLDLKKLQWEKVDDLRPFREKLAAYRSRIRLILPRLAAAHPEAILLASMFHHYQG